jgi:GGDEF domain-containing protein
MEKQQKNKTGTSSLAGTVIAALCILIYLFALVQAAVRLYMSIDQRRITADREFSYIADLALTAGMRGFMDEHFIEAMNNALSSNRSIEAIIISGPDGEYAFERQKGRAVTWVNNSPRFINRLSFSKQSLYRPLPIHDLRNVNIQAVAGAFDHAELTNILKETLLLILAGFALAFFTMLLQLLLGKPAENTAAQIREQHSYETIRETGVSIKTDNKTEETVSVKEVKEEKEETVPKGLYSPRSNIGWEEYTNDRLDSELHRCASTEKDLTLLAMEFTNEINSAQFRQAAEDAVSFFTSRDLLFEHGRHGITVIYPGIDLETGLAKAQQFCRRVMENIPGAEGGFYIGISSRSGRLLNAERMLLEAGEALKKAKHDRESPIIAFKSDLDKYRKFIASQNQTRS